MNTVFRKHARLFVLLAGGLSAGPAMAVMVNATQASFQYVLGQANITNSDDRHLDSNALDGDTNTFRSLGTGGTAVFGFGTAFKGDVTIWETTFGTCTGTATCSHWPESVNVFAGNSWDFASPNFSIDYSQWTSLGSLGNEEAQEGGTLLAGSEFKYLLVVDRGLQTPTPIDGFDVAKVSVNAVPIPAAGWLFGSALLGLAAAARRRRGGAGRSESKSI